MYGGEGSLSQGDGDASCRSEGGCGAGKGRRASLPRSARGEENADRRLL